MTDVATKEYAAPEILMIRLSNQIDENRINHFKTSDKIDSWSAGVTFYEWLSGRLPYEGNQSKIILE